MYLNHTQIASITFGAARVAEETDGFHFYRFTEHEEALYKERSADYYKKTFATSGISLEFDTDSTALSLMLSFSKATSRNFAFADIYVNDIAVLHIGSENTGDGTYSAAQNLGNGKKSIRIYLPWTSTAVLHSLGLDDGASLVPAEKSVRMLMFGDSITQGYDALYPSHSYACLLAAKMNADARNKAIGGERFCPELLDTSEDFAPTYITVAYGTNDWSARSLPGETEKNMKAFYTRLSALYPNATILALAPIWRKDEQRLTPTGPFSDLEPMLRRTTEKLQNVTVIAGYDLVPHDPTYYSDLYLHPNDAGFAFYAERLYAKLSDIINGGIAYE